jgi:hypothetical protein
MPIDLPRPRTAATKSSDTFGRYTYEIRKELGLE